MKTTLFLMRRNALERRAFVLLVVLLMIYEIGSASFFKEICNSALGMGNFKIPPTDLLASRQMSHRSYNNGRINDTVSGWCTGISSDLEWFQIDLKTEHYITAVANQGTVKGFVYEFTLAFSRGLGWLDYMENGTAKIFRRNHLLHHKEIVVHNLSFPVRAKTIRLYPKRAIEEVCMRLEIYGCQACLNSFGLKEGLIPNKAVTSSSSLGPGFEPFYGRLDGASGNGSWCAKYHDLAAYLQIDLGDRYQVSMIAVQGNQLHEWLLEKKKKVNCSSEATGNATLNLSLSENITLVNRSFGSSEGAYNNSSGNVTLANRTVERNYLGNSTSPNNTAAVHNSSAVESEENKITVVKKSGKSIGNNTCFETKYISKRAFVKSFTISYSDNAEQWKWYYEGGIVKVFEGSINANTTNVIRLNNQLIARYVRIHPRVFQIRKCMRVEIYGCKECFNDLGAGTGELSNEAMSASSYLGPGFQPWLARLLNPDGAWCSDKNDGSQYLQIHFSQVREIRQLRTQGSVSQKAWVKTYFIQHSQDGETWTNYTKSRQTVVINGNVNEDQVATKSFLLPFTAKFVRIRPVTWQKDICLRMELYGCKACNEPLGMESQQILNSDMTASSWRSRYYPYQARLNYRGGWGGYSDRLRWPFIQVKIPQSGDYTVTGVATQPWGGWYVKYFILSYSFDAIDWVVYREDAKIKVFEGYKPSIQTIEHEFKNEITGPVYIRLHVIDSSISFGLRFELYGCKRYTISNTNSALGKATHQSGNATVNSRLAVDGNHTSDISLGSCSLTTLSEIPWWRVDLLTDVKVTGVFITNRGDGGYRDETELSIRVGYVTTKGGIDNPPCGGLSYSFPRGAARMVRCKPEISGTYVTIFSLQGNSTLSLCEVEVETSQLVKNYGVGMWSGLIPDERITASSSYSSGHLPYYGRLGTNIGHGAWCAAANNSNQFLEIDLGIEHSISGITIEGKHRLSSDNFKEAWVTEFLISFTTSRKKWNYVTDVKTHQPIKFVGNDADTPRRQFSLLGFTGKVVRIHPKVWNIWPCIRVELEASKVCSEPLGLQQGEMSLTASRSYSDRSGHNGRLHNHYGWGPRPEDPLATLKIDFWHNRKRITAVAIQSYVGQFVISYELLYSPEGLVWRHLIENAHEKALTGPTDPNSITRFILPYAVDVRSLILRPEAYYLGRITRVEVYGCEVMAANYIAVGVKYENEIANSSMTASSWKPGYYPYAARLFKSIGNGSWCAGNNKVGEYLQVDIGRERTISRLAIQGDSVNFFGVTQFSIVYSQNGVFWKNYTENEVVKVFPGSKGSSTAWCLLSKPFSARKIRIVVKSWYQNPCMRIEIFYQDCKNSVDMSLNEARRGGYTASSFLGPSFEPWRASLLNSSKEHGWCADNSSTQFLEIDLGTLHQVTGVSTWGVPAGIVARDSWVEEYKLQYREFGGKWIDHMQQNTSKTYKANSDTLLSNSQNTKFYARFVRVIPTKWHNEVCMKVQLTGCKVCSSPLGMEEGNFRERRTRTSPAYSNLETPQLNHVDGFLASYAWSPFVQVDLGPAMKHVTAIAVQGIKRDHNTWSFYVKYMKDGSEWFNYTENGVVRIFRGGQDMDMVAKHYLNRNLTTRFIRVNPLTWGYQAAIRMEFYGCSVCEEPLGIEKGLVNITATSHWGPGYETWRARLRSPGIWRSKTTKVWEFLQVNFAQVMDITGIATEGDTPGCGRVKTFYLHHSLDGLRFEYYHDPYMGDKKLLGNEREDEAKFIALGLVIRARHVRIRPLHFVRSKCMRIELYGCRSTGLQGIGPLGFESGIVANTSLKSSSTLNWFQKPGYGRLNTVVDGGGWCARDTNTSQYFEVDLHELHKITNIMLQGKYSGPTEEQGWVTKFSVTHSKDGIVWSQHSEEQMVIFDGNAEGNLTRNHKVTPPLFTRHVRLYAKEWHQMICMRVELIGCKACANPLGLENGHILDNHLDASSNSVDKIRLHNNRVWMSSPDSREFVQVTLAPYGKTVTALALQGEVHWVSSFTLRTSDDGTEWMDYIVQGKVKVFPGCTSQYEVVRRSLPRNITSRYLRLHPRTWQNHNYLSLELYGCDECADPLGMVSGLIPDSQIRASSFQVGGEPWRARLGLGSGWIPLTSSFPTEYLEIDLGEPKVVSYVEVQGAPDAEGWSSSFLLDYKMDSSEIWKNYKPRGFRDPIQGLYMRNMILRIPTEQKLEARFLKFIPKNWVGPRSLKLEIYGCSKVCSDEVGFESWRIRDPAFTSSSYKSSRSYPWMARLHSREAWCAGLNDTHPFLQVDLGKPYRLRYIATQGLHSRANNSAWVKQYTLEFRKEHSSWISYVERSGSVKLFSGNADGSSVFKHQLTNVTNVRYCRLYPKKWHNLACMRVEFYGCKVFNETSLIPLGMSDHRIPDSYLLASDMHQNNGPWMARLHSSRGCWVMPRAENFLQVDLGQGMVLVTGVATQGCRNNRQYGYVLEYQLSFSDDGAEWYYYQEEKHPKVFSANMRYEQDLPVRHVFNRAFYTRYVKFHVIWFVRDAHLPALRVEIYGKRTEGEFLVATNATISSSSSRYPLTAQNSIISSNKTWCAEFDDDLQYLEVDLKQSRYVMEILTQGAVDEEAWVENYTIWYGDNGNVWTPYKQNGFLKVFLGNKDSSSTVSQQFSVPILARFIRIYPISWHKHICMRIGSLSAARIAPLGIQKNRIHDAAMTAFSHAGPGSEPWRARLDSGFQSEAWRAGEDTTEQYLQIDLGERHNISHVATQGRHGSEGSCWVTQYNLSYSVNGSGWIMHTEDNVAKTLFGNTNDYGIVKKKLTQEIKARYIRYLPVSWFRHVCMKVEIYGYRVCGFPLGVNSGELMNGSFAASSFNVDHEPWAARLNRVVGAGAWCAASNKSGEYLEIDLGHESHVTGISTQGKHGQDKKWVTEYALYTRPGISGAYLPYTNPNGTTRVFTGNTDQFTAVMHKIEVSHKVQFLKFVVNSWHNGICMRVEVLGCKAEVTNGGYSEWSLWSACSASCVGGVRSRERECTNPKQENGGKNCSHLGVNKEVETCNTSLCPAINMGIPSVVARNTPVLFTINDCTASEKRLDFGDCNVINTSLCVIEHTYSITGMLEIVLQLQNHSVTRRVIIVQDPVTGFDIPKISKAVVLGDTMFVCWRIELGTAVLVSIDFGDNTTQSTALANVSSIFKGSFSHLYKFPGVFLVTISATNAINNATLIKSVYVEIPINVSCLLVENLGPFHGIYQKDQIRVTVRILNGSNPEMLFMTGDGSNFTQSSTEFVYSYRESGERNITVFVYNNVSTTQISRTIKVHDMTPIGNIILQIPAANVSEQVPVAFNVTGGFPYECFWDFGDGNVNQTSSFQNVSFVRHAYQAVGAFNVIVNCSNNFGFAAESGLVFVQRPIKNLSFVNDCPQPIDRPLTFNISTSDRGTNSCYVINLGDGTILGFGHAHCSYEKIQFTNLEDNYFSLKHNYTNLGRYYVRLKAWNLVSVHVLYDKAVVVKIPCNFPTIKVPEFEKDINSRPIITPLQTIRFHVLIDIDCRATDQRDVTWSATLVSASSRKKVGNDMHLNPYNRKLEALTIGKGTLTYGVYVITCNVSMVGQAEVYSIEEGYIEVIGTPLIPFIDGGSLVQRAFDKVCTFDGSDSRDPDDTHAGLSYYWLCQNASFEIPVELKLTSSDASLSNVPSFNATTLCNTSRKGVLMKAGPSVGIHTGRLQPYSSYAVVLFVAKTVNDHFRMAHFTQVIKVVDGDPPVINIRCKRNCGATVNPSEGLLLEAAIEPTESGAISHAQYQWNVFEKIAQGNNSVWKKIHSKLTKNNRFHLRENTLVPGNSYKVCVTGKVHGRSDGYSENEYSVGLPPRLGRCGVDKRWGCSDDTVFNFKCEGWVDKDLPLSYEFQYQTRYGVVFLLHHGLSPVFSTSLPVGDVEANFTLDFRVKIFDAHGTYNTTRVDVQVFLGKNEQNKTLSEFQNFINASLSNMLLVGKIQEATREVNAIASVLNAYAYQNGSIGMERRLQMRTELGNTLAARLPLTLFDVKQIGSALSEVVVIKEEVPVDVQENCLKSFKKMANIIGSKLHDRSVLTSVINDTAVIVETGLMNIIRASSDSARVYGNQAIKDKNLPDNSTKVKAREIALNAMAILDNITNTMSSLTVVGEEPIVMSSPHMSLVLQKMRSDIEGEHTVGNGKVMVQFPNLTELIGKQLAGGNIDVQMLLFHENPFTWDMSATNVSSHVLSVLVKDDKYNSLNVSSLQNYINLYITRDIKTLLKPADNFMKEENGSMRYHKFGIKNAGEPMSFQIIPDTNKNLLFEINWRQGERPNTGGDNFVTVLPDFTSCKILDNGEETCDYDPYTVFIDSSLIPSAGEYYMGIASYSSSKRAVNGSHSLERRSCREGARSKRSCIEYKDPPPRPSPTPQGEYKIQIPGYDAETDVNYTVNSFTSPCMYWDEERENWTSQGCKVGKRTRVDRAHCLCNHLTSFGGGFLVAPNPIDFDKVFEGFKNLSDNVAVLATIVTAFAFYILMVIWLRRMDKRDETIGIPTVIDARGGASLNTYEVIIQTGPWRGSGTTANVFILMVGEEGDSYPIALKDETKTLFSRGSTNEFFVSLPNRLGKLLYLKMWHDLSGIHSSWYLSYVIIRDTQTDEQYIFACDRWFALEKEDGSVSRVLQVSDTKELTSFGVLFRTKTSKDMFDGHLWISVVGKPSKSKFTRVQRLTCCMSLLFSTMITNAMFYNLGNQPDASTVTLGPLNFSLKQIMIGVQSSFIALPFNILILQIFRNVKPTPSPCTKYKKWSWFLGKNTVGPSDFLPVEDKPDEAKRKSSSPCFPHWFVYVAYTLCLVTTLTAAAFTLFYSMAWGKEISNKWLSSMLISFVQDAFVTQPLKIFLAAVMISLIIKKLPSDFTVLRERSTRKRNVQERDPVTFDPEEAIKNADGMCQPPDEALVEKARIYKMNERKAFLILKESFFHLLFLWSVVVISYSARDPDAYTQSNVVRQVFSKEANDIKSLWSFVENNLLQFVFKKKWYNGEQDLLEGFTDEKSLYIVGMPRLRQLRTKPGICEGEYARDLNMSCDGSYSFTGEEKGFFLPGWVKKADLTFSACPIPWRYQTAMQLDGVPFWGRKAIYSGGGFTADLGYFTEQAKNVIRDLQTYNWIDKYTRAVFVELTLFNAPANLFSSVTYLLEFAGTGAAITFLRVDTFSLYQHVGSINAVVAVCEFMAIVIFIVVFYLTCRKIYNTRMAFFKNIWNIVDVAQLALCFSAVALYVGRIANRKWTMNKLQENPFIFISFHYAIKADELNTYVISSIVFIASLKLLQILSFNPHIAVLGRTISKAGKGLLPLGLEAFIVIFAFNIFAYVVFGNKVEGMSDFVTTFQTTLGMTLGNAYFMDLSHADRLLGPLFFTMFVLTLQFFLLNMFMTIIMDTYSDVNAEITGDSPDFEMARFLLSYLNSLFGRGSEFQAGDEIWRKTKQKLNEKPVRKRNIEENCELLKEKRKLMTKKIKSLYKLDNDLGKSEVDFAELWSSHCTSDETQTDKQLHEFLSVYLCHRVNDSFDFSVKDDFA